MAALNQRRGRDDGEKTGIAQQRARAGQRRARGLGLVQRLQPEADEGAERRHPGNDPDQVFGGDEIDQQPAAQRADHEGRRPPQPQRPVIEAVTRHASQRIGVGQRHHRRPHACGGREHQEYRQRLMQCADHREPERGQKSRGDQRGAQRLVLVDQSGDERQDREPRHRRHRRDDADPRRVNPDRLQPDREKRQLRPEQAEHRAIKQRQPRRESLRACRGKRWGLVILPASIQLRFA